MFRCLLPAFAAVLTLALSSPSHARGPGSSGGMSHSYSSHNYNSGFSRNYNSGFSHNDNSSYGRSYVQNYGTKFSHGYSFGARNFYYSSRCWSSQYGCYCYYCPYVNSWYYWCGTQSCYYPVSYITVAPATVVVTPPTVAVVTPPTVAVTTPPSVAVTTTVAGAPGGPVGGMPPAGPSVP